MQESSLSNGQKISTQYSFIINLQLGKHVLNIIHLLMMADFIIVLSVIYISIFNKILPYQFLEYLSIS